METDIRGHIVTWWSVKDYKGYKKYFGVSDNEIIPYQNLGNAAKATLRRKCLAFNANFRNKNQ